MHHTRGVHAYNYGNFMLWDILFGTFRNPATFTAPGGLLGRRVAPGSARCCIGRDVGEPGARQTPAARSVPDPPCPAA